jgi:signal transduction histidine kinase
MFFDDLSAFASLSLYIGIVAFVYAVFVNLQRQPTQPFTKYALFILAFVTWATMYIVQQVYPSGVEHTFSLLLYNVSFILIPVLFLNTLCRDVTNVRHAFTEYAVRISYGAVLLISGAVAYDIFSGSTSFLNTIPTFFPDSVFVHLGIYLALYIFVIVAILHELAVRIYHPPHFDKRERHITLLVGTLIGFFGVVMTVLSVVGICPFPYSGLLAITLPVILGHALLHRRTFVPTTALAEVLAFVTLGLVFFDLLLSETLHDALLRTGIFVAVSFMAYILIRLLHIQIASRESGERLARYLANANARLRDLDRQKTEFVSIASHQLRGPTSAIIGYASLINEGSYGQVPEHLKLPLSRIFESGKRISIMVDDFLNVTRIEQGRMAYYLRPCDLGSMVSKAVEEMRVIAEQKGLSISYETNIAEPVFVDADESKLVQVFQNLVDNSIKYTVEGSVSVSMRLAQNGERVLVIIRDTGIGIAPEEMHNLFQKFNRATNANSVSVYGAGLGLYIAREMVKAHQGWIHISSPGVGKGATFTVELPVRTADKEVPQE